jgi:hypothetical protein
MLSLGNLGIRDMEIDHEALMRLVIGWTCVGVFVCTAVITLLALVGVLNVEKEVRDKLYTSLIVEIVVIAVAVFAGLIKIDPKPVVQQLQAGIQAEQTLTAIETSTTGGATPPAPSLPTGPNIPTEPDDSTGPGDVTEPQGAPELQPRVYIHIADNAQRDIAVRARDALRDAGQLVPGIERVGAKAPNETELRYFLPSEEILAETISKELAAVGIEAPARFISGFEDANIRPHHFELWFART